MGICKQNFLQWILLYYTQTLDYIVLDVNHPNGRAASKDWNAAFNPCQGQERMSRWSQWAILALPNSTFCDWSQTEQCNSTIISITL